MLAIVFNKAYREQLLQLAFQLTYPAVDVSIIILSVFILVKGGPMSKPQTAGIILQGVTISLIAMLAACNMSYWESLLAQLSISFATLIVKQRTSFFVFIAYCFAGLYRLLYRLNGHDAGFMAVFAFHYIILLIEHLLCNKRFADKFAYHVSFTDQRKLINLRKLRELILEDLPKLPKRWTINHAYGEFKYDTRESLFLIRAITRMIWRPLLPLFALEFMLNSAPLLLTKLESKILDLIDNPTQDIWYYVYVMILQYNMAKLLKNQLSYYLRMINSEIYRISDVIHLELFQLPLIRTGPTNSVYISSSSVRFFFDNLRWSQPIVTSVFVAAVNMWSLYNYIGRYAFIPAAALILQWFFSWALKRVFGSRYYWDKPNQKNDTYLSEIYDNIKSIKLYGWESYYLNSKPTLENIDSKHLLWYAPIVRGLWLIDSIISNVISELTTYVALYFFIRANTGLGRDMSNSQIFELSSIISGLRQSISSVQSRLVFVRQAVEYNIKIERSLRGDYLTTLSRQSKIPEDGCSPVISISECNFSRRVNVDLLKDISFSACQGELVGVVGEIGSGKSSLLLAMCGEIKMTRGSGYVSGSIGYLPQKPWIMNETFRENITFGRKFDEAYFWKVVDACALTEDLLLWPDREMTVIGDQGINISGGQRARLSLARTIYSRSDVYILDDPLSAVDAHVKQHILDNVLLDKGLLGNKLRIIATNVENILPFCTQIITMEKCKASIVSQVPKVHSPVIPEAAKDSISEQRSLDLDSPTTTLADGVMSTTSERSTEKHKVEARDNSLLPRKWTNWENAKFMVRLCGFSIIVGVLLSAIISPVSSYIITRNKISALRKNSIAAGADKDAIFMYLRMRIYSDFVSAAEWRIERFINNSIGTEYLANKIQSTFIQHLIHAPISYFESTTKPELMHLYDTGAKMVGTSVLTTLLTNVALILSAVLQLYQTLISFPHLLVISPLLIWLWSKKNNVFSPVTKSITDLRLSLKVGRNKVTNIIYGGGQWIRMFGVGRHFSEIYSKGIDSETRLKWTMAHIDVYSGLVTNLINISSSVLASFFLLLQSNFTCFKVTSADYSMFENVAKMFAYRIRSIMDIPEQIDLICGYIDTYRQSVEIQPEAPYSIAATCPPTNWPSKGRIEFCDFTMSYSKELEPALRNINLTIRAGEKIGIVGRSGAGKSSLVKALFRLVHGNTSGKILIDGVDISTLGVGDLRSRLGVIPQESAMFSGTFATNLDPLGKSTIEDMWAALIKCDLAKLVEKPRSKDRNPKPDKTDEQTELDDHELRLQLEFKERREKSGLLMKLFLLAFDKDPKRKTWANYHVKRGLKKSTYASDRLFSNGQHQLFSLCRLLMRKHKVVVLDEATADVDIKTDQRMQRLIREEFADSTVLTIAHRLDTIKNSDRIIVMSQGKIVEVGTPQELLEKNGYYADLVRKNEF